VLQTENQRGIAGQNWNEHGENEVKEGVYRKHQCPTTKKEIKFAYEWW